MQHLTHLLTHQDFEGLQNGRCWAVLPVTPRGMRQVLVLKGVTNTQDKEAFYRKQTTSAHRKRAVLVVGASGIMG